MVVQKRRSVVYYLDFYDLYKPTTPQQRRQVRSSLNRNDMMRKHLRMQKYRCFYCGEPLDMSGQLDHLIPVYYGGTNRSSNLVAACKSCNYIKLTHQIEITNERTINDYLSLIEAKTMWDTKVKRHPHLKRYQPKKVRLYGCYLANHFKSTKIRYE